MREFQFFINLKGLISAIIFCLLATELFIKLSSVRALNIKLPNGVPPAVGKSFAAFLPFVVTLRTICALNTIVLPPVIVTNNLYVQSVKYSTLIDASTFTEIIFFKKL